MSKSIEYINNRPSEGIKSVSIEDMNECSWLYNGVCTNEDSVNLGCCYDMKMVCKCCKEYTKEDGFLD